MASNGSVAVDGKCIAEGKKQAPSYKNYIMHPSSPMNKVVPVDNNNQLLMAKISSTDSRRKSAVSATGFENKPSAPPRVENELARWIRKEGKILMRTCVSFVEKPGKPSKNPSCMCGRLRSDHFDMEQKLSKWDDNNTQVSPTDAFGEILFTGYNQRIAKYVRVDHNQRMKPVLNLMTNHWQLEPPDLIISVTGGAKNFHMKPRLKELFRRGLMKAAESTRAWIVTGGMHAGVMKHVGEAVRDYTVAQGNKSKIVALGIVPWGAVNNKEQLVDDKSENGRYLGKWPANYKANIAAQRRSSPLDPNHSHFILVDNGTQNVFGTEIEFRAKLEREASLLKTETNLIGVETPTLIPSVCVVLEGGPGTLKTVKSAIESGTPAVIVEGSGRAADIIAYAYANSGEEVIEVKDTLGRKVKKIVSVIEEDVMLEVSSRIKKDFGERNLENNVSMVRECIMKRDHISVYRQDGGSSAKDIDVAILQALLKVSDDNSVVDQLKLALAWNQIEIAKSDIFRDDYENQPEELHEVMFEAILNNKPDFVRLFMENGVDLAEFLTIGRLLQFYNNVPHKELLYSLLNKARRHRKQDKQDGRENMINLCDVADLIQNLMGDFYSPLYHREAKYRTADPNKLLVSDEGSNDRGFADEVKAETNGLVPNVPFLPDFKQRGKEMIRMSRDPDFTEPARELFIWNVLMNRRETALLFWDEGREGIAAALVAQKLLKGMLQQANDSELERELNESLQFFESLAVGVLSECYLSDEPNTHKLLVRELPLFGQSTIIALAVEADNKVFIAHAACQTLFSQIWGGKMTSDNSEFILWSSIFFPPLIPLAVKFRQEEKVHLETGTTTIVGPKLDREGTIVAPTNSLSLNRRETVNSMQAGGGGAKKSRKQKQNYSVPEKLKYFYMSPIITFRCNTISYIAFLILFAGVLLTDFNRDVVKPLEYCIIIYVVALIMEEARQLATDDSSSLKNKFTSYCTDPWNILDMVALLLFVVGEVLRFIDNDKCFTAARIILAFTLMTFCFRVLHIFSVHKELGPKLVMIGRMMVDLLYFVLILLIFVVSYGLAIQVILYPNAKLEWSLIQDVLEKAYFQIYGEFYLEEIKGEIECTKDRNLWMNDTLPRCPESEATWLVPIVMGIYILITNVLMINLLIAMFSYTFSHIQDNTDKHWSFQRYHLTREYHDRPFVAPPFIIIMHVYLVIRKCCKLCCTNLKDHNDFRKTFAESEVRQVVIWENMTADEYLRRREAEDQNTIDNQLKLANLRVDGIAKQVEDIIENSFLMQKHEKESNNIKLPPVLDDRLDYLEKQMERTSEAIDWMMKVMVANGTKVQEKKLKSVKDIQHEEKARREKERKEKKEKIEQMIENQLTLHQKSRDPTYPTRGGTPCYRSDVPDDKVPWTVEFKDYSPKEYEEDTVLRHSSDPQLLQTSEKDRDSLVRWNSFDDRYGGVNRETFVENARGACEYDVVTGLPLNPSGRTGLCGRGALFRWGPNHAGDPIVTRWKRDASTKDIVRERNKPKLEFLAVQRQDNKEWAIPGSFLLPEFKGDVSKALKVEFVEEALGNKMPENSQKQKLDELWKMGKEVYKGYADDPRNTDNAWIETTAVNYHDETGTLTAGFKLQAGGGTIAVGWREISGRQLLYGVHLALLYQVAERHNAFF